MLIIQKKKLNLKPKKLKKFVLKLLMKLSIYLNKSKWLFLNCDYFLFNY